jgi:hypothetical protein
MTPPELDDVRHGYAPEGGSRIDPPSAPPLRDIATKLIAEVRTTIAAEQDLLRARLALFSAGAKRASIWGSVAVAMLFFAAMALVFGSILTLATYFGPLVGTLVVSGLLLLFALIAAVAARGGARDAGTAFKPDTDEDRHDA